jgi:Zn-dependent peptidase ImmA (M78 family)
MQIKEEAERQARWVLEHLWEKKGEKVRLPVDPVQIAHSLGIDVLDARLDPDVYAALVKEEGQDPTILLNGIDSRNRKRFSCAHELGHFMRHSSDEYAYIDRRDVLSAEGTNLEEIYANTFAASLLMPEEEARRLRKADATEIEMAEFFAVSADAMKYRLKNLGLG